MPAESRDSGPHHHSNFNYCYFKNRTSTTVIVACVHVIKRLSSFATRFWGTADVTCNDTWEYAPHCCDISHISIFFLFNTFFIYLFIYLFSQKKNIDKINGKIGIYGIIMKINY